MVTRVEEDGQIQSRRAYVGFLIMHVRVTRVGEKCTWVFHAWSKVEGRKKMAKEGG